MVPQLLVSVAIAIIATTNAANPWFCQSYDCPAFTSQDMGGYEIRNYAESNWVATSIDSSQPDPTRTENSAMFRKLFNYISGQNANNQKIDMTVPVLTKVESGSTGYRITMMFYIPFAAPAPTGNNGVYLVTKPAGSVFVKSFPSYFWVWNSYYRQQLGVMKNEIGSSVGMYDDNVYYKAGYNSPWDFMKRKQHEVWMDKL